VQEDDGRISGGRGDLVGSYSNTGSLFLAGNFN